MMRRYVIIALALLVAALAVQTSRLRSTRADRARLEQNQTALMTGVSYYQSKAGQEVAAKEVLTLRVGEFERLRAADAAAIRDLGIKLRRVEATAKTATATVVDLRARLRDTVVVREVAGGVVADTLRAFRWHDPWVSVDALIDGDSVTCRVASVDTLRQVIHRVPRRFLFIKWGTKAIRQEIVSSNPHARVVYAEYVRFD